MTKNQLVRLLLEAWSEAYWLKKSIRKHRDARGHDRCWENDLELYRVLGEPLPDGPALPPREEFLERCAAYHRSQAERKTS